MATELNPNSTDLTARNGFGKVDWVAAFVGGGLIVAGFAGGVVLVGVMLENSTVCL
ncbi:MAG: hypothetical protein E7H00_03310 [Cutibacterium avidum]|nr:hypothetical protein [Cutibacterium avidum]